MSELLRQLNEAKLHSHMNFQGLDISIEIPAGGERTGVNKKTGEKWAHKIDDHYGYIKGTHSPDGEHLDCYVRKNPVKDSKIYVMHQLTVDGSKFDEDKVMLGYESKSEAIRAFKKFTFKPGVMYGGCTEFNLDHFKVVAFQASNSKAMLTDEATYEEFKKAGLLPSGVKSPVQVARRVSESLSEGLSEIGYVLSTDLIEDSLKHGGVEEDIDLETVIKKAYSYYKNTAGSFFDVSMSEDEFRMEALKHIAEKEAYMTDTLDEFDEPEMSLDDKTFISFDDHNKCIEAGEFAEENDVKAFVVGHDLYFETPDEYETFIDLVDISSRKDLLGNSAEDVLPEEEQMFEENTGEPFAVVIYVQGMKNIGTVAFPQWATTGDHTKLVQSGIQNYNEARKIAEAVSAGEIQVPLNDREYVLGIDVIRESEYRQFHEAVVDEKIEVEQTSELEEVKKLAGVKSGVFESRGVPSVHETRARLAAIAEETERAFAEQEVQNKRSLSEDELARAARVAVASINKNPNHMIETVVEAVSKKMFDDMSFAPDIIKHMQKTTEVLKFDNNLEARDILDRFAARGLIIYKDLDKFTGTVKVTGSTNVIQRLKDEFKGV